MYPHSCRWFSNRRYVRAGMALSKRGGLRRASPVHAGFSGLSVFDLADIIQASDDTKGFVMLMDGFGPRMQANMEIALERACRFLPVGTAGHEARRYVARKILECAERGNGSVRALTAAGRAAAIELHAPDKPAGDSLSPDQER